MLSTPTRYFSIFFSYKYIYLTPLPLSSWAFLSTQKILWSLLQVIRDHLWAAMSDFHTKALAVKCVCLNHILSFPGPPTIHTIWINNKIRNITESGNTFSMLFFLICFSRLHTPIQPFTFVYLVSPGSVISVGSKDFLHSKRLNFVFSMPQKGSYHHRCGTLFTYCWGTRDDSIA